MANTYRRLGINLLATAGTDIRVKVSANDTTSGFLDDKTAAPLSGKLTKTILNANSNETIAYDVNEGAIDHDSLLNFVEGEHRLQDDAQTTNSTLWSSQKVQDELDNKVNKIDPVADNRLLKSVGSTGVDMEQTAITVDDSGNVTGIQDLTVSGDLTIEGTTTSVNSENLDVTDANITVNNGGTEASANLATAGLTVEMSDATDVIVGFDSTLTSKFKIGEEGDLREVVTTTHTQSLLNKTIDADSNTISNLELDNLKAGVVDLDDTLASADDTKIPTSLTVKNYVDTAVASKDEASEISYDNTDSGLAATDVKEALDELTSEKIESEGVRSDNSLTKYDASGKIENSLITEDSGLVAINSATSTFNLKVNSNTADAAIHLTNTTTGETVADGAVLRITNDLIQLDNKEGGDVEVISGSNTLVTAKADGTLEVNTTDYETLVVANNVLTNKKYVDDKIVETSVISSIGDIAETSFTAPAGETDEAIVGFAFSNAEVRSFSALVSVERIATSNFYEVFDIKAVNIAGDWMVSYSSVGEASNITFDVEPTGQVTYTDVLTPAGHTSTIIKFRAITTSV